MARLDSTRMVYSLSTLQRKLHAFSMLPDSPKKILIVAGRTGRKDTFARNSVRKQLPDIFEMPTTWMRIDPFQPDLAHTCGR